MRETTVAIMLFTMFFSAMLAAFRLLIGGFRAAPGKPPAAV
jgi:hypothetical protein